MVGKVGSSVGIPQSYRGIFDSAAKATGVSTDLLGAIAKAESSFNPNATSSAGAKGIMQLMPGTARDLGVDPTNPAQSVMGGAKYIKSMLDKYGSTELALAAYNWGPGNLDKAIAKYGNSWAAVSQAAPAETRSYVSKVTKNMTG